MTTWPSLPYEAWRPTRDTLHRYVQIVGKIQLALTPRVNHFWNVTLHLTPRGLATSALPYRDHTFDIELDLVAHRVIVRTSEGEMRVLALHPLSVADFEQELFALLASLEIDVRIWDQPVELVSEAIPFSQDHVHASYDRDAAATFLHVLTSAARPLEAFRARFQGKCSGVGFYWGTFDLSVARYNGRPATNPPTTSVIEREAYSHEVSEVGFWPGDARYPAPAFFALHYPLPAGFAHAQIRPSEAAWREENQGFVLPYEPIRDVEDPDAQILAFCQSTYEAGADLAGWNRAELERA